MSFSRFLAHRALEKAVQTKAPNITLLNCMQDVMESDRDRQGMLPLFPKAVDLLCHQEPNGISRITALASLVRAYEPDNFYSRDVIATLRGQAKEFHHACSGPFPMREQIGFRLFYDLHSHCKSATAREAFSQMACTYIDAFEKGEAVSEANKLSWKGPSAAYDYMVTHHLKLAEKLPVNQAIHSLRTRAENASPKLAFAAPYAAVANILSITETGPEPTEWLIDNALWSLEHQAEKHGGKNTGQLHMAVMLSETWLPAYANQHGITKAAPYLEKLYALTPDQYITKAVTAFMAPRLDLLAAEPGQLGPAAAWAKRIGANTPEVIAFTEHNLARLFKAQAEEPFFKTLISYASPDALSRFADSLPTAERDAFSLLRPRHGALKISV